MTAEVLVGTRKGLVVLRGERGGLLEVAGRSFEGLVVEYAMRDPRSGLYYASVTTWHFGPKVYWAEDAAGPWNQADGPTFPEATGAALERIWSIVPAEEDGVLWAGVAPAALFRSEDGGRRWALNRPLWEVPGRDEWSPGAGGLCLHSICPWPGNPQRLALGISAAGVWITEDGGQTWDSGFTGLVPGYIPEEARAGTSALCVHNMHRARPGPSVSTYSFTAACTARTTQGRRGRASPPGSRATLASRWWWTRATPP